MAADEVKLSAWVVPTRRDLRKCAGTAACFRGPKEYDVSMNTVPVSTFNRLEPAQQLQRRFQQAGIRALLHDESKLERFWFMSEPLAVIHLEVEKSDYLTARQLLQQWDQAEAVLREAVRCPECASSRVEFPQITRKFAMPVVQALLMA